MYVYIQVKRVSIIIWCSNHTLKYQGKIKMLIRHNITNQIYKFQITK